MQQQPSADGRHAHAGALLSAIRQACNPTHQRLEQRLPLVAPDLTRAEYVRILQAFHAFYAALEAVLEAPAVGFPGLDWPCRRKTPWLAQDLAALHVAPAVQPTPPLPAVADAVDALGCLYVLEGATLGGQLSSRAVARSLGLDADTGARFLAGYGEHNGRMWRDFLRLLQRAENWPQPERARIVAAAAATFAMLEQWLNRQGALR